MNTEKKAKKKMPSSHSPTEDNIKKITDGMSEKEIMSMQEAGENFLKKMAKNPEKITKMVEKFSNLDPDELLAKITEGEGKKEDIELLAQAVINMEIRVTRLEEMFSALKPMGDAYEIEEGKDAHFH